MITMTEAQLATALRSLAWRHGMNLRQRAIADLAAEELGEQYPADEMVQTLEDQIERIRAARRTADEIARQHGWRGAS